MNNLKIIILENISFQHRLLKSLLQMYIFLISQSIEHTNENGSFRKRGNKVSIFKIDRSVVVDEKAIRHRKDELYKLVNEIMDQHDLETLMIATLSKIAFIDYMLGLDVMENKRLESMINMVNSNRNTNHQLTDFYIRF